MLLIFKPRLSIYDRKPDRQFQPLPDVWLSGPDVWSSVFLNIKHIHTYPQAYWPFSLSTRRLVTMTRRLVVCQIASEFMQSVRSVFLSSIRHLVVITRRLIKTSDAQSALLLDGMDFGVLFTFQEHFNTLKTSSFHIIRVHSFENYICIWPLTYINIYIYIYLQTLSNQFKTLFLEIQLKPFRKLECKSQHQFPIPQ